MKTESIMTKDVGCCRPDDSLTEAARIMWDRDCGFVPVAAEDGSGRVVGILTDRDICMAAYTRGQRLGDIRVADVMSRGIHSCRPGDDLRSVEEVMRKAQVHRLPVVDGDARILGVISLADIVREAARERGARAREVTAGEITETIAAISQPRQGATAQA